MKIYTLIIFSIISFSSYATNQYSRVFENDEFLVILDIKCSPCDLDCKNIHYHLFNKTKKLDTTGPATTLTTGTFYNFRGYMFRKDNIIYSFIESDTENIWDLLISKKQEKSKEQPYLEEKTQIALIFDNSTC